MGIEITPSRRDSKFNDLATLKISHSKGAFETPNRMINRHDINAKDNIGAEIPLTSSSKTFMLQENVDPEALHHILNDNGYLDVVVKKVRSFDERADMSDALVLLYPHLTADAVADMSTEQGYEFVRFFGDVAVELQLDSVVMPVVGDLGQELLLVRKRNLQLIPVLNLRETTQTLSNQYEYCRKTGANDIPLIAFKFAPFPKANKGYNMVMDTLDKLHEGKQATLILDAPRRMRGNYPSISGPHYAPFFIADLVSETYRVANWQPNDEKTKEEVEQETRKSLRLFCKNDLTVPEITSPQFAKEFIIAEEARSFENDRKLKELLMRIAENRLEPADWRQRRPFNLSRVHENIRAREEFELLQKRIGSGESKDYLAEKKEMNAIVSTHLKDRKE